MGCHARVHTESEKLAPVRASWESGEPIEWVRVHDLPDYVYFNHSAHVTKGVGCVSCHDRIDKMEVVQQKRPLSMAWCINCHRAPEEHLRPKELITAMDWRSENQLEQGLELKKAYNVNPSEDCSTCHR
jgi:hypothetical protein